MGNLKNAYPFWLYPYKYIMRIETDATMKVTSIVSIKSETGIALLREKGIKESWREDIE